MSERRPRPHGTAFVVSALAFALLYVPLAALMAYSFIAREPEGSRWTLDWYRLVLGDRAVLDAFETSLWVGFCSTAVSTLIGTAAAIAMDRFRFRGYRAFEIVTDLPLIMPEIVLGLALLIWFVALHLTLGTFSIILAHITFSVSYVIITVRARLDGFDRALEEAAQDLGATPARVFISVTLPLILPGIVSGALMAFTLSFDDFLITFFTAGVGSDTLPLKIYSMIKFGVTPEINALSVLLLAVTLVGVGIFFRPFEASASENA